VLHVDEGSVLTSAGVAAGLDLCLHVIRRDHGAHVASRLARHTVVAPHREGGQAQFIERPIEPVVLGAPRLGPTRAWALERLEEPLTVTRFAALPLPPGGRHHPYRVPPELPRLSDDGRPNSGKTLLSANQVIPEICSPSSAMTSNPHGVRARRGAPKSAPEIGRNRSRASERGTSC
jgi:hypothetical protein